MQARTRKNRTHKARQKLWYFTKQLLLEAADKGPEWDFNRQLNPEPIRELPEAIGFPVVLAMKHCHRHCQPAEEHIRCMILVEPDNDVAAFADVPWEFWNRLPYRKAKHGTTWESARCGPGLSVA
jgi:hypothetical protein